MIVNEYRKYELLECVSMRNEYRKDELFTCGKHHTARSVYARKRVPLCKYERKYELLCGTCQHHTARGLNEYRKYELFDMRQRHTARVPPTRTASTR